VTGRVARELVDVTEERRTYVPASLTAERFDGGVVEDRDGADLLFYGALPPDGDGDGDDADRVFEWLTKFRDWMGTAAKSNEFRLSGIKNAHVVFGHSPPVPLRRRYGAAASHFTLQYPGVTMALERIAARCAAVYAAEMPEAYQIHTDAVADIHPGWLLGNGSVPWTSGIINRSSVLPYHKDAANVVGSMSAMVVFRSGVDGGELHVPALDLVLPCDHGSLSIFDGCRHLHGVTPFSRKSGGERFSIVFYAKREFLKADPPGVEVRRAQRRATELGDQTGFSKQVADEVRWRAEGRLMPGRMWAIGTDQGQQDPASKPREDQP
jgi:hypothetical protein